MGLGLVRNQIDTTAPETTTGYTENWKRLPSVNALSWQRPFKIMYRSKGRNNKTIIHRCYCVFSHDIGNCSLLCTIELCVSDCPRFWKNNYFLFILRERRVFTTNKTWSGLNIVFIATCIMLWCQEMSSQSSKPKVLSDAHNLTLHIWTQSWTAWQKQALEPLYKRTMHDGCK